MRTHKIISLLKSDSSLTATVHKSPVTLKNLIAAPVGSCMLVLCKLSKSTINAKWVKTDKDRWSLISQTVERN